VPLLAPPGPAGSLRLFCRGGAGIYRSGGTTAGWMRERGGEGSGEEEIREMQERGSVGDRCGEEEGAGSRERGAGRM
jgi:hypothetical protein